MVLKITYLVDGTYNHLLDPRVPEKYAKTPEPDPGKADF
jgi:hypothetical protein